MAQRSVGQDHVPLVIVEIGINHEGDMAKARHMIDDAAEAGAECVKFQCHVIEDEMAAAARTVIPGNAQESIWHIMERCAFSASEERDLKAYAEDRGLIYLSTPFSRRAADRLEAMDVPAYKIGSGECNNYPLIDHIASFGKPVILSTGMNNIPSVARAVETLEHRNVAYALLQCTSMYPTPYSCVHLGALEELQKSFPQAVVGLSDHSLGIYTALGAVPLGARILEKHFTSDPAWPGPDIPISITPGELRELMRGTQAIFSALGGQKRILPEEQATIDFAYACVVTTQEVAAGEALTEQNCWVKRPGTGGILAAHYGKVLGRRASCALAADTQLRWEDIGGA